ncbi:hypothetical protein FNH22_13845 [Fulvivirga sp. M361]|uniref:hypothetical protein n=1 Tax=Fulvivirga sp. M361 TaxID=2594266 RepID=UPI00117B980E|nr:hypothetical protein [Fulvivirga sp. M361]TRX58423.1 hypothetical protein FNH22_13845 [Fulvivirga sp. M361]
MEIETYDEVMHLLDKELASERPDTQKMKELIKNSECPYLQKLISTKIQQSAKHCADLTI